MSPGDLPDVFRAPGAGSPGARRRRPVGWTRREADVLGVIALGGGLGSLGRYGIAAWLTDSGRGFPTSTFVVNVAGCVLIGALMVFVADIWRPGRYARPFLGIGVLGGFTTYSTMMLDLRTLVADGEQLTAGLYLIATLSAGLAGVWLGAAVTRMLAGRPIRRAKNA